MKRFECLKILSSMIDPKTIVVGNVGPISREWNALRPSEANLLQVNLGLCAAVGLGISVSLPHRQVVILDGDGNLLLNLASLADMANQNLSNTIHIVLDNEAYEGGGGLRSATAGKADLSAIARGAGVPQADRVQPGRAVGEGAHEDAEHDLGAAIAHEVAQQPRGVLRRGDLQGDDGQREHQPGDRDHGGRHHDQQRAGVVGGALERQHPQRGVVADRHPGQQRPGRQEHHHRHRRQDP